MKRRVQAPRRQPPVIRWRPEELPSDLGQFKRRGHERLGQAAGAAADAPVASAARDTPESSCGGDFVFWFAWFAAARKPQRIKHAQDGEKTVEE